MKTTFVTALLSALLAACASNPTSGTDLANSDNGNSGPKTKRACETVRTNQTGQRLRRVCREIVVKSEGSKQEES